MILEPPLHPTFHLQSLALPSPVTHMLALSSDYFIIVCGKDLELWDYRFATCQAHVEGVAIFSSKVRCYCEWIWIRTCPCYRCGVSGIVCMFGVVDKIYMAGRLLV